MNARPFRDVPPSGLRLGRVRLRVADAERSAGFYRDVIGLRGEREGDDVALAASPDAPPLFVIEPDAGAPPRPAGTTGLYHTAILLQRREDLALLVRRIADRGWPFEGFSDHAVSEAVYLADPEGNGLELYADRPRSEWRVRDGEVFMTTRPLDVEDLFASAGEERWTGLPAGTTVGHIHLQVADLAAAERFYHDGLGLDVTTRRYPGALFLAAGGYHHHVGLNTWAGRGAPAPPPGSRGLVDYEVRLPDAAAAEAAAERLRRAGFDVETDAAGRRAVDADGIGVRIVAGSNPELGRT